MGTSVPKPGGPGEAGVLIEVCLGVLVPVYNEVGTLEEILRRLLAQRCVQEVVIVDDGSTDGSLKVAFARAAQDARLRVLRHSENRGKGAAIRTGLKGLSAPVVIIQDADLEYEPGDYQRLLEPIRSGKADVVYGSRFAGPFAAPVKRWHRWGNTALTALSNRLTGFNLTDEATCYKVFRRELLEQIRLEESRFGFCPEVTVKVSLLGVRLVEVPIRYRPRSRREGKKIRWRHGMEALCCLAKYAWRNRQRSRRF